MSKTVLDLFEIDIKENPLNYVSSSYCLENIATKQQFWTSNGFFFYGLYRPSELKFTIFEKIRFSRLLKKLAFYQAQKLNNSVTK